MMFNYPHIAVEQYFTNKSQRSQSLQSTIASYNMTPGQVEEWLNNYTTLMNIWFCENLYYPGQTDNNMWVKNFRGKLLNQTRMSVNAIISMFGVKTLIQNNDGTLAGVEEFKKHLMKYEVNYKYTNHADLEKETLTGQRMNLTLKIFNEIRRDNKATIGKSLEKQYPLDVKTLADPNRQPSHIDISHMEYDRESKLIDYLLWFDGEVARPIFVQHGYI